LWLTSALINRFEGRLLDKEVLREPNNFTSDLTGFSVDQLRRLISEGEHRQESEELSQRVMPLSLLIYLCHFLSTINIPVIFL
jgi:hypothetical protein